MCLFDGHTLFFDCMMRWYTGSVLYKSINTKNNNEYLVDSHKSITFAADSITNHYATMETTIIRRPTSFRLRADLLEELKRNAARQNRTLNNYVESVLLDIVYNEPNEVTKAAIKEAKSRKVYPENELYSSAEDMFKALNAEIDEE